MRGAFLSRRGHPLARRRGAVDFERLRAYPIASTPLSDEVARVLVERYGPDAHPASLVTLRCEELPSLAELARRTDAVLFAIRAAGPDLGLEEAARVRRGALDLARASPEAEAVGRDGGLDGRRCNRHGGL